MKATEMAQCLGARRTGTGKWQARCPAHSDRSPSLSIREGADGRILLHCFAGCTVPEILAVLKLSSRDLFAGPPPTSERVVAVMADREARARAARAEREARRTAWDRVRKWEAIVGQIGVKLALDPENDALGKVFHRACDRLHDSDVAEPGARP